MKPYELRVCMASSLDGRIADGPGKGPNFGSKYDRKKLFGLRAWADLLLVGANTVRLERLPALVRNASMRVLRLAEGRPTHPALAIFCESGALPFEDPFFTAPKQKLYLVCRKQSPEFFAGIAGLDLELVNPDDCVSGTHSGLSSVLQHFAALGYQRILAEGGGQLIHALLAEKLVDRFYLTIAPLFLGGAHTAQLVKGPPLFPPATFKLSSHEVQQSELHLVYEPNE